MKFNLKNFLNFEKMITPVIIKILFWIALAASAIGGIATFFVILIPAIDSGDGLRIIGAFLLGILSAVLSFALGALISRIYAELLILFFRINETLSDIKFLLTEKTEE